jgi:hypothetical protein
MWYSAFLAVFFCFWFSTNGEKQQLQRSVEPVGHFLSMQLLPLACGSLGVADDLLNPMEILLAFAGFGSILPDARGR